MSATKDAREDAAGQARLPLFESEDLSDLEWLRGAPYLEPQCYLLRQDGSNTFADLWQHVVFVKEGYFEQCKAIHQPELEPRWTSFGLRRWQASRLTSSRSALQQDGIGYCRLGLVEECKVIGISFHRRKQQQASEPGSGADEATRQHSHSSPGPEDPMTLVWSNHDNAPSAVPSRATTSTSAEDGTSEASDDVLESKGPQGKYFVRLVLQRLPQKNDRVGPVCTVIDHFVDCGVGEWLIPKSRYDAALARRWRKGDKIEMFWADPGAGGRGQLWEGTFVGMVKRSPNDPALNSPWAAITVKWTETGDTDNVSMWEISSPQGMYRDDEEDSGWGSDWNELEAAAEDDEDWEIHQRARRDRTRRRQAADAAASPSSQDSDESLELAPARKFRRGLTGPGNATQPSRVRVPETMQPRNTNGKLDWNKGHCVVCMARPDGSTVLECDGTCLRSFHYSCLSPEVLPAADEEEGIPWFCPDCRMGVATCSLCKQKGAAGTEVLKCRMGNCGNYFHASCLRSLAAGGACLKIHRDDGEANTSAGRSQLTFTCPGHYCDRCHLSGDSLRIWRCWTCPKALHGKCMEPGDSKLNNREIECSECAAARTGGADQAGPSAAPAPGPQNAGLAEAGGSGGRTGVHNKENSSAHSNSNCPPENGWIATMVDLRDGKGTDLVGKTIFHYGSHKKGGGCDFAVPVPNVKFHSALKVLPDGNVVISYCHNKARDLANIHIRDAQNRQHTLGQPEQLSHGDTLIIAAARFRLELRPRPGASLARAVLDM